MQDALIYIQNLIQTILANLRTQNETNTTLRNSLRGTYHELGAYLILIPRINKIAFTKRGDLIY